MLHGCISRENAGRGLIVCENSVKSEENALGRYFRNNIEPLLVAVRTSRTITHKETVDPKDFKKTKEEQRKNECTAKRMMNNLLEIWKTRIGTTHGDA